MGVSHSLSIETAPIYEVIKEEFLSLKPASHHKINYDELRNFKVPKNFVGDVDLNSIETLYLLDHDKDGLVSLEDVKNFCLRFSKVIGNGPDYDIANRFQRECIYSFIDALDGPDGPQTLSKWTLCFVTGGGTSRDTAIVPEESIMLLFRLFAPLVEDMDSLKFFRLFKNFTFSKIVDEFLIPFYQCYLKFHLKYKRDDDKIEE
jgi:hypothetical protein